jgi:hypothetical protein
MAENINEPGYNFLWQRAKFGNILFSGSNISQLNNDAGYLTASGSISSSISSSYATSASYAVTASYALTAQTLLGSVTSASYASTASYVLPLQQNVIITGSLLLTSSYISTVDYIDFNNTGIPPPTDIEGRIYWDEDNGTLSLGMHGGQVVQQVGLENYFYIKNQSGVTIPNGSVVRAAGTLGASGRILGDLMIANGSIVYYFTLGIATEDIINGEDGYITEFGNVRNVNTTGASVGETWIDGDVLWVSPTVLGGLTKFEPDSPNLKIQMAIVINAAANGTLFVRPDLSGFLTDLHNVNDFTTTGSFGDLLVKSGSTWINSKQLTGSYGLTGSLTATSFTGSLFGTASFANTAISSSYAVTASFALNGGGGTTDTGSLLTTASIAGDIITFTKGNGSTFPITVPTGSGGTVTGGALSGSFGITIDGGGSAITTGNKGYLTVPYGGTITGWRIISDQSGSCVIDVWKAAGTIPTVANTIAGTEKPTLTSQQINSDINLTTWTSSVSSGDIFAFYVDSTSLITRVNLSIFITKQ